MSNLSIRPATLADLDTIESIYDHARAFMRQTGNLHQWVNGYPSRDTIVADLAAGHLFVCEENSEILGVFCFFIGNDPTYEKIYDGTWLKIGESGVIIRNIVLFGVLIYELFGPTLTKIALTKSGDIQPKEHKEKVALPKGRDAV